MIILLPFRIMVKPSPPELNTFTLSCRYYLLTQLILKYGDILLSKIYACLTPNAIWFVKFM